MAQMKKMFTTNGSFTVPSNVVGNTVYVSGCAGGGGGSSIFGCGGGGGESVLNKPIAVTPGQVINIAIGAGGAGCQVSTTAGSLVNGNTTGTRGGNTIFGTLTLQGGGAAYCDTTVAHYLGGSAGGPNASQGTMLCTSLYMSSSSIFYQGGNGGSSLFGIGGNGGQASAVTQQLTDGSDGVGFGAGGGGGGTWQYTSTGSKYSRAGSGTNGVIIITWEV